METKVSYAAGREKADVIIGIIASLRPRQWTKNLLIFAGIIFSRHLFELTFFLKVLIGFFIFSLVSGSVYIINDLKDLEEDKKHPVKCKRPLPSGQVSPGQALLAAVVLSTFSIFLAFVINTPFGFITLAYYVTILLYTFYLKQIVILDVLTIAAGFVFRAIAGAVIIGVYISPWLIICTVLLALFLALSKRRHEISLLKEGAGYHRRVLEEYSIPFLDQMISIVTSGTIIAYSLYSFSSDKGIYLMASIPFVIYGIFRYLYLIHKHNKGGSPEVILLEDKPLLLNVIFWVITAILILYLA